MSATIVDPEVPYIGPVGLGKFAPQQLIRIQGSTPSLAYRFNINLQCGPKTVPQDDVAIQISVRLLDGLIALNSLKNGVWDEEERHHNVPIKRAEGFEIILLCETNTFKVAINGQHYCEFPQRINYDKITHLSIDGDVSILQISYEYLMAAGTDSLTAPATFKPVAPIAIEVEDDFDIIEPNMRPSQPTVNQFATNPGFQPPLTGFQPPLAGFQSYPANTFGADPPPYDEIVSSGPPHTNAPYPKSAPYPTGPDSAPYPVGNSSMPQPYLHPLNATGSPYGGSCTVPLNAPYALDTTGATYGGSSTIPLNAVGSPFQPIKRDRTLKHICSCIWTFFIIVIMIVVVIMTKHKRTEPKMTFPSLDSYTPNYDDVFDRINNNNDYNKHYKWE